MFNNEFDQASGVLGVFLGICLASLFFFVGMVLTPTSESVICDELYKRTLTAQDSLYVIRNTPCKL